MQFCIFGNALKNHSSKNATDSALLHAILTLKNVQIVTWFFVSGSKHAATSCMCVEWDLCLRFFSFFNQIPSLFCHLLGVSRAFS